MIIDIPSDPIDEIDPSDPVECSACWEYAQVE